MDYVYKRQYLNLEGKRRKKKYVRLDERIGKMLEEFQIIGDLGKCLCTLFYIQKLDQLHTTRLCISRYSEEPPKSCCGLLAWKPGSLRWFIALIAVVAVCCVLVGTALGAMRPAGRDHLTVSLLMIGVGIVLVTVSGVAWRLTSHDSSTCRAMLGLGSTESVDVCPRRFVPRLPPSYGRPHHPYAAMIYPEFQYRPPPPSYQASMQEYRLRLLLLDRGHTPQIQAGVQNGPSPPPTYRSYAGSLLRAPLSSRRDTSQSEYSFPPSYRSQTGSTRPAAIDFQTNVIIHSREQSLSLSDSNQGGSIVNGISIHTHNDEDIALDNITIDSLKMVPESEINPVKMLLKSGSELDNNKDGNLVTIVQTSDQSPVIVTVSGCSQANTEKKTDRPTRSPYKNQLEEEKNRNEAIELKRKQREENKINKRSKPNEKIQQKKKTNKNRNIVKQDLSNKDEDIENDVECMYCNSQYSKSKGREGWIQCYQMPLMNSLKKTNVLPFSLIYLQLVRCMPVLNNFDIWGDQNNSELIEHNEVLTLKRLARVLNFFPVPFEEECLSTDRRRKGVCMNAYECNFQGGKSHGKCALGFGVCCIFTVTCSGEIFNNITYFVNPDFPDLSKGMTKCSLAVKKIDPDIAQLKLDFIHFSLGQPNRRTGVCDDDVFLLSGGASKDLKLCGLNSGQHALYDIENANDTITISMNLGDKILSRLWEVRIVQIPFSERAPSGCLQYHTGTKGIIQTMNFADNGRHLADQEYNICMRQEFGMCSIAYQPCHENSFKIGSSRPAVNDDNDIGSGDGNSRMDNNCDDKIYLPCESEDLLVDGDMGIGLCNIAQCGGSFCPMGEKTCRIESSVTPFTIGVQFGPGSREDSPEDNLGMCLKYEQIPCA
ncbi:hypothetical protein FQA39_LY17086 [Lamprigera yunnana]|nr:hypothetical protein FQA39_LY17086 [Lamprigera yunnana]